MLRSSNSNYQLVNNTAQNVCGVCFTLCLLIEATLSAALFLRSTYTSERQRSLVWRWTCPTLVVHCFCWFMQLYPGLTYAIKHTSMLETVISYHWIFLYEKCLYILWNQLVFLCDRLTMPNAIDLQPVAFGMLITAICEHVPWSDVPLTTSDIFKDLSAWQF